MKIVSVSELLVALNFVYTLLEKFENGVQFENAPNVFRPLYARETWKLNMDFCPRKTRSRKSRDSDDVIAFESLRFQNVFRPY